LRPPFYCRTGQGTMSFPRHKTEHQHHLPPTDRWTVRALKSMVGTIHTDLYQLPVDQLGSMVAADTVRPQLLDKLHDKENAIRSAYGIYTETACVHIPVTYARSNELLRSTPDGLHHSTGGNQKRTTDAHETCTQKEGSMPLPSLCCGAEGMARGDKPKDQSPNQEVHTKTLWPLPYH
jgi:hypothetical protein